MPHHAKITPQTFDQDPVVDCVEHNAEVKQAESRHVTGVRGNVHIEDFQHCGLCRELPTVGRLLLRYQTVLLQVHIELFMRTAFKQF